MICNKCGVDAGAKWSHVAKEVAFCYDCFADWAIAKDAALKTFLTGKRPMRIRPVAIQKQHWVVAEHLAAEGGLELHTDAGGFPVLVVPKIHCPVRPDTDPVPGQTPPADKKTIEVKIPVGVDTDGQWFAGGSHDEKDMDDPITLIGDMGPHAHLVWVKASVPVPEPHTIEVEGEVVP